MASGFAEEFIQGFTIGQRNRLEKEQGERDKQNQIHSLWQQEVEKQDRDVNKQILSHQLKRIKIEELMLARDQLKQQYASLQGADIMGATPDQLEGGILPSVNPATGVTNARFKPVDIPGIDVEDFHAPGFQMRPQSMQEVVQQKLREARLVDDQKSIEVSPAASVYRGGNLMFTAPPAPLRPDYTKIQYEQGGKPFEETVTQDEAARRGALPQYRAPVTTGTGSSANRLSPEDRAANVAGIMSGDLPPVVPNSAEGMRLKADLQRAGYKFTRAQSDWRSTQAFLSANAAAAPDIIQAAENLKEAMDALDEINEKWDRGSMGPLSWASIVTGIGKNPLATDAEAVINIAKNSIATLRSVGNNPTTAALKSVEDVLSNRLGKTDLADTIKRLRMEGTIRVNGIRTAGASSFGTYNGGQYAPGSNPGDLDIR